MTTPDIPTDVRLLRLPAVLERVGLSRDTVYGLIRTADFPAPRRIGLRGSAWRSDEVDAWIASRPVAPSGPVVRRAD